MLKKKKMKIQLVFKRTTRVAKVAVKKMKKYKEDFRSLLVRYKEAKCEIETLNGELTKA